MNCSKPFSTSYEIDQDGIPGIYRYPIDMADVNAFCCSKEMPKPNQTQFYNFSYAS